jgi:hypothetical protein
MGLKLGFSPEQHELKAYEKIIFRTIFGPKKEEIRGRVNHITRHFILFTLYQILSE